MSWIILALLGMSMSEIIFDNPIIGLIGIGAAIVLGVIHKRA